MQHTNTIFTVHVWPFYGLNLVVIKESYFSILQNMGDLATEIEQMQNDIHAFDEEIDALEQ